MFKAENRSHDDCVTSLLWGLYFIVTPYFDRDNIDVKTLEDEYDLENDGPIMFLPS